MIRTQNGISLILSDDPKLPPEPNHRYRCGTLEGPTGLKFMIFYRCAESDCARCKSPLSLQLLHVLGTECFGWTLHAKLKRIGHVEYRHIEDFY